MDKEVDMFYAIFLYTVDGDREIILETQNITDALMELEALQAQAVADETVKEVGLMHFIGRAWQELAA